MVKFSLAKVECLTLTLSLRVIPANIAVSDITKNCILWPTFLLQKVSVYFQPLLHNASRKLPNSVKLRRLPLLRLSRSFKVTNFGTNRKLIGGLLLVINSNLPFILHRVPRYSLGKVQNRYIWLQTNRQTTDDRRTGDSI